LSGSGVWRYSLALILNQYVVVLRGLALATGLCLAEGRLLAEVFTRIPDHAVVQVVRWWG